VAPDGRVAVGSPGRVDFYSDTGVHAGGFAAGTRDRPADVTAVRLVGDAVLVADAAARIIRRYDLRGTEQGVIGAQNKTGGFMLPNKSLDFDVMPPVSSMPRTAASPGHVVDADDDGGGIRVWHGEAEDSSAAATVNAPYTDAPHHAEKMIARVKVFSRDRTLLAVIGPEHFDPMCRTSTSRSTPPGESSRRIPNAGRSRPERS
jgi:hypothetical protein